MPSRLKLLSDRDSGKEMTSGSATGDDDFLGLGHVTWWDAREKFSSFEPRNEGNVTLALKFRD